MSTPFPPPAPIAPPLTPREAGSALLIAIFMLLVISVISLGLLSQTFIVSQIAGAERWSVKAFYAADSGLNLAQTRARIQALAAFDFTLRDMRGPNGLVQAGAVNVHVDQLQATGAPRLVIGSEANAGQGSGPSLIVQSYRTTSRARHELSRSERVIGVIFGIGPMPATIPD
jgi:hypothetical protein